MKIGRNEKCPCNSGKKFKYCHLNIQETTPRIIPILKSKRFLVTVKYNERRSKIFQIYFTSDGSLYVDFPYFENSYGIASELSLSPFDQYPKELSLKQNWKITSHLVKYAHHPDWEAHFSQDGKVRTEIRKKSVPLVNQEGHLFTLMVQWINAFEEVVKQRDMNSSIERKILCYDTSVSKEDLLEGIKFIGWWYPRKYISPDFKMPWGTEGNPIVQIKMEDRYLTGFLLSSPYWEEYLLFLSFEQIPLLEKTWIPCLSFIWWFDAPEIAHDHSKTTSMLALSYPRENSDELKEQIESMDFIQSN